MTDAKQAPKPQIQKFREIAKELEADDREEVFDVFVRKIAKARPKCGDPPKSDD